MPCPRTNRPAFPLGRQACLSVDQGGRKRCSTVAPLQGTKAKREAQRRRKRRGREEKRKKGGEEEKSEGGRKGWRKESKMEGREKETQL